MSKTQLETRAADAVLETVAARENVEPTELEPPLYHSIDPDALNNLFAPRGNGRVRADGEVEFTYYGYEIRVTSTGDVSAAPVEK